jgi:hypothetical protein
MQTHEAELSAPPFARASPVANPKMGLLFWLATLALDCIVAISWRLDERPCPLKAWPSTVGDHLRCFGCSTCGQVWSLPSWLRQPFTFRCACGERMIVHLDAAPQLWQCHKQVTQPVNSGVNFTGG